jgi:hypothetical protein
LWLDGLDEHNANPHDHFIYSHRHQARGQNRQPGEQRMRANAQYGRHRVITQPKKLRKALLPCSSLPKQAEQHAAKGGEIELKFLKAIMIMAILASALSLGACAQRKEEVVTTPGKTSYGK